MTSSRGLVVQGDGKILIGGSLGFGDGAQFAIARYLESGSLDSSFGVSGLSQFAPIAPGRYFWANAISLQSSGRIVMVGSIDGSGSGSEWAVSRCHQDGSVDKTFGAGGVMQTTVEKGAQWARACTVAVRKDDTLLVGGCAVGTCAVVSYGVDGHVDETFGERGIGVVDFRAQEGQQMLAVHEDHAIVLSGAVNSGGVSALAVSRYLKRS